MNEKKIAKRLTQEANKIGESWRGDVYVNTTMGETFAFVGMSPFGNTDAHESVWFGSIRDAHRFMVNQSKLLKRQGHKITWLNDDTLVHARLETS